MKLMHSLLALLAVVLFSTTALADAEGPVVHAVTGEVATQCVKPTPDMRKNHMDYLLHHRDRTMYKGIRTDKFSFKECMNCHAKKDETGNYMSYKNEEHFCMECHGEAAVTIDCFECHASKPEQKKVKHSQHRTLVESFHKLNSAGVSHDE